MRVAIAGGGIAGLASALLLARRGHDISVFEVQDYAAGGNGILLQPAGLDVLERLGLASRALALGCAIDGITSRDRDGASLMDLRYAELRPGLRALGIRRPVLAALLRDATIAAGVRLICRCGIEALEDRPGDISLVERLTHDTHGPFDLALVCDGLNSRLRQAICGGAEVRTHRQGVYSVVAPLPESIPPNLLVQRLDGLRDAVGLLPIGRAGGDTPLVSFFWNAPVSGRAELEARGYHSWCAYIESFCPEARGWLRDLGGFASLPFFTTAQITMRRWHEGRALVMGDAAHALDPHLGVGATMALLDAECLDQCLLTTGNDVTAALADFETRRRRALSAYVRVSSGWSQLDGSGFSALRRRLFLAAAGGFNPLRRRLLTYICGYAS